MTNSEEERTLSAAFRVTQIDSLLSVEGTLISFPELDSIYELGRTAALGGLNRMACPYLVKGEPERYEAWMDGFDSVSS